MISYRQALKAIIERAHPLQRTRRPLRQAAGYVLARDIHARAPIPRFDQSAMDGFAVRAAEVKSASAESPIRLKLIGEVAAGAGRLPRLRNGTAIKVMTGGRIPPGADAVVIKEHCSEQAGFVEVRQGVKQSANIRFKGEEFEKGEVALRASTRITPPAAGMLATLGWDSVDVYRKPIVSILTTGNELVAPGRPLKAGQIHDSNGVALEAALKALGIEALRVRRLRDDPASLRRHLDSALQHSDVLITVGGVSVGDYDLVKQLLEELRVRTVFWRVAIKPGKPNFFGVRGSRRVNSGGKSRTAPATLVFGLPGNPVSALVSYHQLVKPALLRLMGVADVQALQFNAALQQRLTRAPGRLEFMRAVLSQKDQKLNVRPARGQGSHMLGALAVANALLIVDPEQSEIDTDHEALTELLNWHG